MEHLHHAGQRGDPISRPATGNTCDGAYEVENEIRQEVKRINIRRSRQAFRAQTSFNDRILTFFLVEFVNWTTFY